jgi:hypothetical protein
MGQEPVYRWARMLSNDAGFDNHLGRLSQPG